MFSRLTKLVLTVDLVPGESATSLGSRLARRNGVQRLITFCSDIGINYFALANGDPKEVARLAALGGIDPALLQHGTPHLNEPGWFRLGAERIRFTAFGRTSLRICPSCLAKGHHLTHAAQPGLWQLSSVRSCAVHGCYLVPLPKGQNGNDTFDVMRMLEEFQPIEPCKANQSELALEQYLCDRVQHGAGNSWLDQQPFHVAAQACEMLGLLVTHGPNAKRDQMRPRDWAAAGSAGFRVLYEGPDAFRAKLKAIQTAQPLDNTLYRTRFRVFFEWLRYRDDDRDFDVIRDIVRQFVFRNFPIAKGQVVLGQQCPEQYVHSLATARSSFGISNWKLGRRLAAIGLARRAGAGQNFFLDQYVPADVVRSIVTEVDALRNATDSAELLGLDRMLMAKLTACGLVRRYYDEHNISPLYHPSELDRFIRRFRALATADAPESEMQDIPTAARRISIPTERVAAIILENSLRLYANDPRSASFRDFRISLDALRQLLKGEQDGAVNPSEAARHLRVSIRTVRGLLDRGILEARMVSERHSARTRRYVASRTIDWFAAEYITVVDLAAKSGRLPGVEAVLQFDRGVQPLALDARCNLIFRRGDVLS